MLNRIGDKEHPCLTPVLIFTHVHVQMCILGRHPVLALTEGGYSDTCYYPLRNLGCLSGDKAAQACAPTNCVVFNHRYNCVSPDCDVLHCDSLYSLVGDSIIQQGLTVTIVRVEPKHLYLRTTQHGVTNEKTLSLNTVGNS